MCVADSSIQKHNWTSISATAVYSYLFLPIALCLSIRLYCPGVFASAATYAIFIILPFIYLYCIWCVLQRMNALNV